MARGQSGLVATPNPLNVNVSTGASPTSAVVNVTFNGSQVTITTVSISPGASWLQAVISGTGNVTVTTNPSGLAAGMYTGSVTAVTAAGTTGFQVNLTVGGGVPPGTPAPPSVILVLTGLGIIALYQARRKYVRVSRTSLG
jgi:hypothetical protein